MLALAHEVVAAVLVLGEIPAILAQIGLAEIVHLNTHIGATVFLGLSEGLAVFF